MAMSRLIRRASRRRAALAVVAAGAALLLTGCQDVFGGPQVGNALPVVPPGVAKPQGSGKAKCSRVALAYVGATSKGFGREMSRGAKLAVAQHNAANPQCQVRLDVRDSKARPSKAAASASALARRPDVVGVVGPPTVDESLRAGPAFDRAGLVQVTPSASLTSLADKGWQTFYRATGNDSAQGAAAAQFLTETLASKRVCVVAENTPYGRGLTDALKVYLGESMECSKSVRPKSSQLTSTAKKLKSSKPDAVYYAGGAKGAGLMAKALHKAKSHADFVASDTAMQREFVATAGKSVSDGAYFTCPCSPTQALLGFTQDYRQAYDGEPGPYAAESYDVATMLLSGIDAGKQDRRSLLSYMDSYKGKGVSNDIAFNAKGELVTATVWAYRASGGEFTMRGRIR